MEQLRAELALGEGVSRLETISEQSQSRLSLRRQRQTDVTGGEVLPSSGGAPRSKRENLPYWAVIA